MRLGWSGPRKTRSSKGVPFLLIGVYNRVRGWTSGPRPWDKHLLLCDIVWVIYQCFVTSPPKLDELFNSLFNSSDFFEEEHFATCLFDFSTSQRHRRNWILVKFGCESESLFSFPNCVPRFEYAPWLAVKKANVDVLIKLKGNVKRTSSNSLNALRAQNKNRSCFCDATTGFPAKMTSEKQAQKYWWRVTTQIWVVLLIGWIKFPTRYDQSEALPRSG